MVSLTDLRNSHWWQISLVIENSPKVVPVWKNFSLSRQISSPWVHCKRKWYSFSRRLQIKNKVVWDVYQIFSCQGCNFQMVKYWGKLHLNTVQYSTALDITQFKDWSPKFCIQTKHTKIIKKIGCKWSKMYIWSFFNIIFTFLFGYHMAI